MFGCRRRSGHRGRSFYASLYGQIALAEQPTEASLLILYFFLGFVVCAQIGGRMLDRIGARRPVVLGCALAALWAGKASALSVGGQAVFIVMAGAGMGLMLGQANTDAVNRASRLSYGEATGITQTVRNFGASLGFAVLSTVLISGFRSRVASSLVARGLPARAASAQAAKIAQLQGGHGNVATIPAFIRADFAGATRDVFYGMAVVMAAAGVVALLGLRHGVQEDAAEEDAVKQDAVRAGRWLPSEQAEQPGQPRSARSPRVAGPAEVGRSRAWPPGGAGRAMACHQAGAGRGRRQRPGDQRGAEHRRYRRRERGHVVRVGVRGQRERHDQRDQPADGQH
jgi:MFS family permease